MTADQKGKGLYADYLFNIIAGNWERKRPIWVMLMVNSLTESDIKSREIPVLDLYLAQEAERMRKITGAVEKVEEQCVPLNELNFSQVRLRYWCTVILPGDQVSILMWSIAWQDQQSDRNIHLVWLVFAVSIKKASVLD